MKTVFMVKGKTQPEEHLKNIFDCIDKNGELNIAREIDDVTFCTAESEEPATHTEKIKLDKNLADYNSVYAFYSAALCDITAFAEKYSPKCETNRFCNRMVVFAKRINKCYELNVPEFFLMIQKCMFIESILLYKTHAEGELVENDK